MGLKLTGTWHGMQSIKEVQYTCAHCDSLVGCAAGWTLQREGSGQDYLFTIRVCPFCKQPTYARPDAQFPAPAFGESVQGLPPDVETLYQETRNCTGANAYTPAVLACRKILMHIAVDKGATPDQTFQQYVEYLAKSGFVPPDGRGWVDHIRSKGNDANHQIITMTKQDAEDLILFVGMLLKFIYEFPKRVPARQAVTP